MSGAKQKNYDIKLRIKKKTIIVATAMMPTPITNPRKGG